MAGDWTEGKLYGPSYLRIGRNEVLGKDGPLWDALCGIAPPGVLAAKMITSAKEAVANFEDIPEALVQPVLHTLEDAPGVDIGDRKRSPWIPGSSEIIHQVYDYLVDYSAFLARRKQGKVGIQHGT